MSSRALQEHPFAPLWNSGSRVLILGSFPSVKSRETQFYYGHPQNRFWPLMAALLGEPCPKTVEDKRALMLAHGIALWDVIASCEIAGSSDSSIRNAQPTDLSEILRGAQIDAIFTNGKTALRLYEKYQRKANGRPAIGLPSTSPANAAFSMERLLQEWAVIKRFLKD